MLDKALSFIAPHLCCSCGEVGSLLCVSCKNNIENEPFESCVACSFGVVFGGEVCNKCSVLYSKAWCVGRHEDALAKLIDEFKFKSARSAASDLAELLDATLPDMPSNVEIMPIPTIARHIRERGFDHTLLVSKKIAKIRNLKINTALKRVTKDQQVGASLEQRHKQAKRAFRCDKKLDKNAIYLIVDDVITTGATVKFATKVLKDAGAKNIWVAAIARHTMNDT